MPDEFNPYADISEISLKEKDYRKKVKELEMLLCETRIQFLKNISSPLDDFKNRIEIQKKLHLKHRLDDFSTWKKWLSEQLSSYKYIIENYKNLNMELEDYNMYLNIVPNIENELKRLEKLKLEDYFLNRNAFGQNAKDFSF